MNVLIVGAHPDDEVLGVGGTLLKHASQGDSVSVCILTHAYEPQWTADYISQKIKEQAAFDKLTGVSKRFNLDFPTITLNAVPHGELNARVADVVNEVKPDIVYSHFGGDLNEDHAAAFKACLVACRPPKRITLRLFQTPSETEWGSQMFKPNLWVDIEEFIDKKLEAFRIYASEVKETPHPRSPESLRSIAAARGSEVCLPYAEAFQTVREVVL